MLMKTKIVMTSSAVFYGVLGILFSFLPDEIANYLNVESTTVTRLSFILLSALYLGFGIQNWTARRTIIGGIYNRPIAIGNFMHFTVGAIALVKIAPDIQIHSQIVIPLAILYATFALLFLYIFRTHPAD